MGEFQVTEQVFSTRQNQNIKEALTGALSILNIEQENRAIVWKPEQEAWAVFFIGEYDNFVNRFWQEHDLYCVCYGQKRNVLIENLYRYDLNFTSKKYYRRPDFGNVNAELYSNRAYDRNS